MKRILALVLCIVMAVAAVACTTDPAKTTPTPNTPDAPTTKDYKLGMGIVVSTASSKAGTAQVDATVATVVTGADGNIVAYRLDVAQNKMTIADGAVDTAATFKTKMELGTAYGMSTSPYSPDNNGDGVVKEWDEQAKIFENYVVGKTVAEIKAMTTKEVNAHLISTDDALLSAGCTIQITDFKDAVVKACEDAQGMSFKAEEGKFTLGVAAKTTAEESKAATADADGVVKMYTDFAASVVVDGKIVASLNDAIQPNISIDIDGVPTPAEFKGTKRELKEAYGMSTSPYSPDNNGDGKVLEWYVQSAEFSKFVVGKTAAEVQALQTKEVNAHQISVDESLLSAGCTIQITAIKAVVAQSVTNAR